METSNKSPKKEAAIILTLALNEELKQHIWDNVPREDLNKDDGVESYVTFLKRNYGKYGLMDSLDRYKDMEIH